MRQQKTWRKRERERDLSLCSSGWSYPGQAINVKEMSGLGFRITEEGVRLITAIWFRSKQHILPLTSVVPLQMNNAIFSFWCSLFCWRSHFVWKPYKTVLILCSYVYVDQLERKDLTKGRPSLGFFWNPILSPAFGNWNQQPILVMLMSHVYWQGYKNSFISVLWKGFALRQDDTSILQVL